MASLYDPAAYGFKVAGPGVSTTAPAATTTAIGTGTQVYSQLPGYQQSLGQVGTNIGSALAGQVPADVIAQLQQQGAERNVMTGAGSNAAYLHALGLTSLGLEETGLKDLESILPELPGAGIASNPNFYVTPQQQYEADLQRAVFSAAPDPAAAAAANLRAAQAGFNAGNAGGGGIGTPWPTSPNFGPSTTATDPNYWAGGAVGALNPVPGPNFQPPTDLYSSLPKGNPWDTATSPDPNSLTPEEQAQLWSTFPNEQATPYSQGGYDPTLDPFAATYGGDPSSASYDTSGGDYYG